MIGMTGVSPGSDLAAHGWGFLFGLLLMTPFPFVGTKWIPLWGQKALELVSLFIVLFAWKAALVSVVK